MRRISTKPQKATIEMIRDEKDCMTGGNMRRIWVSFKRNGKIKRNVYMAREDVEHEKEKYKFFMGLHVGDEVFLDVAIDPIYRNRNEYSIIWR